MTEPKKIEFQEDLTSPSIAEILRNVRLSKGYSLEKVASQLKVSLQYLEAIEHSNHSSFPERVYILGFVQSYAKFLGLDPIECAERFKAEILQENPSVDPLVFPSAISIESSPSRKIIILSAIALLLFFGIGYRLWYKNPFSEEFSKDLSGNTHHPEKKDKTILQNSPSEKQRDSLSVPSNSLTQPSVVLHKEISIPAPHSNPSEDTVQQDPSNPVVQQDLSNTAVQENIADAIPSRSPLSSSVPLASPSFQSTKDTKIEFEFSAPSWVRITNDSGQIIIEKTFQYGERYTLPKGSNYSLYTGNAGGVQIKIGNTSFKTLGKTGEVIPHLSLDFANLSAYLQKKN